MPQVPHDDIMDVMDMTNKMEAYISKAFKENELNLAMSALMSASINSMLAQCKTLDEVIFYRDLFTQILDSTIRTIRLQRPQKPPYS